MNCYSSINHNSQEKSVDRELTIISDVIWFGEKLNLFISQYQKIIFLRGSSGIKNWVSTILWAIWSEEIVSQFARSVKKSKNLLTNIYTWTGS